MKVLAIIGLVFAALSIFIPVGGIFLAMACSVFALISFYKNPTLSGVTFGINIISTAFLSPSLMVTAATMHDGGEDGIGLYWFYVGFHIVFFVLAIILSMILKKRASKKQTVTAG